MTTTTTPPTPTTTTTLKVVTIFYIFLGNFLYFLSGLQFFIPKFERFERSHCREEPRGRQRDVRFDQTEILQKASEQQQQHQQQQQQRPEKESSSGSETS